MELPKDFQKAAELNDSTAEFSGQSYRYCVMFFNSDGDYIQVPNGDVHTLIITDSILNTFHSGILVLNNRLNKFENYINPMGMLTETSTPNSFKFKNDGKDVVVIQIKPLHQSQKLGIEDKKYPDKDWDFSFIFSVFDEEESGNPKKIDEKTKAFYLRDIKEQVLIDKNIAWSTAEMLKELKIAPKDISQVSDSERAVYTGDAIKHLIKKTFEKEKLLGKNLINDWDDDWEKGGTPIFKTSGPNESPMDILIQLRDGTVGSKELDSCILKYERNRKWSLMPISDYFKRVFKTGTKKPGEFHIDLFPTGASDGSIDPKTLAAAIGGLSRQSFDLQLPMDTFTGLTNFNYTSISSRDSMDEMISTIVHNYDHADKCFNIDVKKNSMKSIAELGERIFAKPMHGKRGKPGLMLPKSKHKSENVTVRQKFSTSVNPDKRLIAGRNSVLDRCLFLGPSLEYEIGGLTYRRAGRFLTITQTQQMPDCGFQDVLQGEWFITKVEHTFTGSGVYRNHIMCTKPYAFQEFYKEKKGLL